MQSIVLDHQLNLSNRTMTALMTAASLSTMRMASSILAFCNLGGTPKLEMRDIDEEALEEVRSRLPL
jgi:hypothetical protein